MESLIDRICCSEPIVLDFQLPTRAVLGQSLLQAKINFLKAIRFILESHPATASVLATLNDTLADTLYFKLAEELLIGCIANMSNPIALKRAAARLLVPMWQQRHTIPIQDFTKLLLSAWRARCRVQEVFGTLVGFHEVVALLNAECTPRFLDFFNREHRTSDEYEALREFLFGLSFEDLGCIDRHMEENGIRNVGREDISRILGKESPAGWVSDGWPPEAVYFSYRRRRMRADYRALTRQAGPRKTAEGYLMEYYLRETR